jgi:hypothetical protein
VISVKPVDGQSLRVIAAAAVSYDKPRNIVLPKTVRKGSQLRRGSHGANRIKGLRRLFQQLPGDDYCGMVESSHSANLFSKPANRKSRGIWRISDVIWVMNAG